SRHRRVTDASAASTVHASSTGPPPPPSGRTPSRWSPTQRYSNPALSPATASRSSIRHAAGPAQPVNSDSHPVGSSKPNETSATASHSLWWLAGPDLVLSGAVGEQVNRRRCPASGHRSATAGTPARVR